MSTLGVVSFFFVLSLLGFTISIATHLLAVFAGILVGNDLIQAMMAGCFPVAGVAFFFRQDTEGRGALPWRSILRWPGWLKLVIGALFLYVLWFRFTNRLPSRWSVGSEPLSLPSSYKRAASCPPGCMRSAAPCSTT